MGEIIWNKIESEEDLPEPISDKLWSFVHLRGSYIGNLETTKCFVQDIQYHGTIEIKYAEAWCEIPTWEGKL